MILWGKPGQGKSVHGKIFTIGNLVNRFTIKIQSTILVQLASKNIDYVQSVWGTAKCEGLLLNHLKLTNQSHLDL